MFQVLIYYNVLGYCYYTYIEIADYVLCLFNFVHVEFVELVYWLQTIYYLQILSLDALLVEELVQQLPATLIISSSELRMLDISLGQGNLRRSGILCSWPAVMHACVMYSAGQFGIVYKAHLTKSKGPCGNLSHSCRDVAVKILKGTAHIRYGRIIVTL